MPATKNKFQLSFFQSYLKNEISAGMHIAHICLSDDDTPNALLPANSRAGTKRPISGPPAYQGQGCFRNSICIIIQI